MTTACSSPMTGISHSVSCSLYECVYVLMVNNGTFNLEAKGDVHNQTVAFDTERGGYTHTHKQRRATNE